jgi:hypothetical protein
MGDTRWGAATRGGGRHQAVKMVLFNALRRAGIGLVEIERTFAQIAERSGATAAAVGQALAVYAQTFSGISDVVMARPADLLLRWPTQAGAAVMTAFDVTIHSAHSAEARQARLQGTAAPAAMLGEASKLRAEPALTLVGSVCHPVALSTNGRMTPRTAAFVKEVGRRLARNWDGDREVEVADEHKWLRQRISVAIHSANGLMLVKMGRIMSEQ